MNQKLGTMFAVSTMMLSTIFEAHAAESAERKGFAPAIDVARYSDSNIYTAATGVISSSITRIKPSLALKSTDENLKFNYLGDFSQYSHSSTDNYQDHLFAINADLQSSRKIGLKFKGAFESGHDAPGSTLAASETHDEWRNTHLGAKVHFGVVGAKGNLLLEVDNNSRRYTTNAAQTDDLEKDELLAAAALYLRLWPKSSIFFRAEQTKIDYVTRNAADNLLNGYFVGIEWDVSNKTSGSVRLGSTSKNFSDSSSEDKNGSSWSAAINWTPAKRAKVIFSSAKGFYDTTGGDDDVIDRTSHSVRWIHAWSSRVKSDVNYKIGSDNYTGFGGTGRRDNTSGYAMNIDYQMGKMWTVGIGYESEQRSSNIDTYDFTRNISMIHLKAAF